MEKPGLIPRAAIDFLDATEWIEKKYEVNVRDYAGRWVGEFNKNKPYLDFWHYICDEANISNGIIQTLNFEDMRLNATDWQIEIIDLFDKEFQGYKNKEGFIPFYFGW